MGNDAHWDMPIREGEGASMPDTMHCMATAITLTSFRSGYLFSFTNNETKT